jgi:hypothetical protein
MGIDINQIALTLPVWIADEIESVAIPVRLTAAIRKHNREYGVSDSRFTVPVQLVRKSRWQTPRTLG